MATLIKLQSRNRQVIELLYKKRTEVSDRAIGDFTAAQKIQAWIRGIRVRCYIKFLHSNAVEVQRQWRGVLGRARFIRELLKRVHDCSTSVYHFHATKIQTAWRGYWVRRYVLDFDKRMKYLRALEVANSVARMKLAEYREFMDIQEEEDRRTKAAVALEKQVRKTHYLVSTRQIPGVYNSPFRKIPDALEFKMRAMETKITKKKKPVDPPRNLPPLPVKPLGPFREPWEVQKQRYRPARPSFRASGDYYAMEKARKQKKLDDWVASVGAERMDFRRTRSPPYVENITTRGNDFREQGYGIDRFREEDPEKVVAGKVFNENFGWRKIAVFATYEVYQKGYCDIQFP